jgi:hypothetical protein
MPGVWLNAMFVDSCDMPVWNADCTLRNRSHCEKALETDNKRIETSQRERRTDVRILVNVPVEITTINHKGSQIAERTFIEDVSDFGCRFSIQGAVRKGDTVAVRLLSQDGRNLLDEPAKVFEVMWIARGTSIVVVGARILGGEKFDKDKLTQNSSDPKLLAR